MSFVTFERLNVVTNFIEAAVELLGQEGQERKLSSSFKEAGNIGAITTQWYGAIAIISVATSKNNEVFTTTRKLLG